MLSKTAENTARKGSKVDKVLLLSEKFLLNHVEVKYINDDEISTIKDV